MQDTAKMGNAGMYVCMYIYICMFVFIACFYVMYDTVYLMYIMLCVCVNYVMYVL